MNKMNKKFINIICLVLVFFLMLNVFIPPAEANPALIALILSNPAYWGIIALGFVASGLIFNNVDDMKSLINKYLETLSTEMLIRVLADAQTYAYGLYAMSDVLWKSINPWAMDLPGMTAGGTVSFTAQGNYLNEHIGIVTHGIPIFSDSNVSIPVYDLWSGDTLNFSVQTTTYPSSMFPGGIEYEFYAPYPFNIFWTYNLDRSTYPEVTSYLFYNIGYGHELAVEFGYYDTFGNWQYVTHYLLDFGYDYYLSYTQRFTSATATREVDIPVFPELKDVEWETELEGNWVYIDETGILHFINIPGQPTPQEPKRLIGFPFPHPNIFPFETEQDFLDRLSDLNSNDEVKQGFGTIVDPNYDPGPGPLPTPGETPFPIPETGVPGQPGYQPAPYTGTQPGTTTTTITDPDTGQQTSVTTFTDIINDLITDTRIDPDTGQRVKNELDLSPLLINGSLLTNKFPFSLPWDVLRALESFSTGSYEAPEFEFSFPVPYIGDVSYRFDLKIWDPIAAVVRPLSVFLFSLSLVFATRRLMGGDV